LKQLQCDYKRLVT